MNSKIFAWSQNVSPIGCLLVGTKTEGKKKTVITRWRKGPYLDQMIKMNITREGEMGIMCFQIGQNMLPALFWPRMNNQK